MAQKTLKFFVVLFCSYVLGVSSTTQDETNTSISVLISRGFDNNPVWVGVLPGDESDHSIQWSYANTPSFSVEFANSKIPEKVVILKRDSVPVIQSLAPESTHNGITVEFSKGETVSGSVVSVKEGSLISEGLVKLRFDEKLDIPLPEDSSVFVWRLEENGTFKIQGLPAGEHTVTVLAPGYMPAEQKMLVETEGTPPMLRFQLMKATYIYGSIVDHEYESKVEGTFEVSVTPPESQTTSIETEFDDDLNFKLGPFAEGAALKLVARTENELRSRPTEVIAPADDLQINVFQWIRVLGSVMDRETERPIPEFKLLSGRASRHELSIESKNGQFDVDICHDHPHFIVFVVASGYSLWASERINIKKVNNNEVDYGVIMLEPVYTVQGRVLDKMTLEPIDSAEVFRDDSRLVGRSARDVMMLRWNNWHFRTQTDGNGEFQLDGFPAGGGGILVRASGYVGEIRTIESVDTPLEFLLELTGSISGQVVSQEGAPVEAMINFAGGGIRTEDGNFHFNVGAGTHRYWAEAELGTSPVVEVTVENGESVDGVRLVIEVIGRVNGSVEGLLNEETVHVWVDGVSSSGKAGLTNGNFELTGVPTGHHLVKSRTSLGRELNESVVIDETKEGYVELIFNGTSSVSGRVLSNSIGLADLSVLALPFDPSLPQVRGRTIRDGSYRLEGLINGDYHVEIPMHDFTQEITVNGDSYFDFHVHANRLSGHVRGDSSIKGAIVRLRSVSEEEKISFWTNVREDGSYLIKGIPNDY
ncbi:MAG: hypothetical protein F4Z87_00950 [Gammaproteobacteria bacterium]|nr:hypothetical protein [Gammaproteobacteria bacterium]